MDEQVKKMRDQFAQLTVQAQALRNIGPFDLRAGLERFVTLQLAVMGSMLDACEQQRELIPHIQGQLDHLRQQLREVKR